MNKIPKSYYQGKDVVKIAKELVGKLLVTCIEGEYTSGIIVETEAYSGINDKACHANMNRRTKRTEVMFQEGGSAYIYLCYGIHSLFNVVTNEEGSADAILIRAIEPIEGIEIMMRRRGMNIVAPRLTAGPGALSKALGISTKDYGTDLTGDKIWLEFFEAEKIEVIDGPRIGVDYAGEDALFPWRFFIKNNKWVSKSK